MSTKKPKAKPKMSNGQWSDRLRGSAPETSSHDDDSNAAGQPTEGAPFTLDELGLNLQPRIKEALCCDDVLEKIKTVIMEAITQQVTQDVYDAMSMDLAVIRKEQDTIKKNVEEIQEKLKNLQTSLDDQEQYSRRECLRFYGVPEKESEKTDDVIRDISSSLLEVTLTENDIARSHRITPRGGRREEQPNPIIVRFSTYNVRQRVYEAKTKLKGSDIFMQEDLTPIRRDLLNRARKMPNVKRVRTNDGRITAWRSTPDGKEKRIFVRTVDDLALLE